MNRYEKRSKNSYDKKAENYDSTFDGKFTIKFKKMMLDNVCINDNSIVVDVACGNGRLLSMFAEKNSFYGCGVDISDKMIEQAKKINPNMNFYVAGCEELPIENEKADVLTVCAAFHHFPDIQKFAEEAERVMKRGGVLYIAEVYLPAILRAICNPFLRLSRAGDVKFYSPNEIVSLFEKNGFVKEDIVINGKVQIIKMQRSLTR